MNGVLGERHVRFVVDHVRFVVDEEKCEMRFLTGLLLVGLILSACGKNDAVTQTGTTPYYPPNYQQAPAPQGYQPQNGGNYGPNTFVPQMPQGYNQSYYPFLPVYQFMQNQQYQGFWNQTWSGWQTYANYYGYNTNDFNTFWYTYCPQQWNNSGYYDVYNYLDQTFYWWANSNTYYPQNTDSYYFWEYYEGYQYDSYYYY